MSGWGGRRTMNLRGRWRALIAAGGVPCSVCGIELEPGAPFDLDHRHALVLGGDVWDRDNLWPAHQRCNRRAGRALQAALYRQRRPRRRAPPPDEAPFIY